MKRKILSIFIAITLFVTTCPAEAAMISVEHTKKTAEASGIRIKQVTLGCWHSAAITTDGDLFCWGSNNLWGQIGNGATSDQLTPVKVLSNVFSIALGEEHSAAITTNGDLYCWGRNVWGQIGNGTTSNQLTPVKVLSNVSTVSLGSSFTSAITNNGDLYCWGYNWSGQIGNGTTSNQLTPVKVLSNVSTVSLGSSSTSAITNNGDLFCWGDNEVGSVGNGTTTNQLTPVKVLSNVISVSRSDSSRHSAAITSNGDLYCWGFNRRGQVGNGTTTNQLTPVKVLNNVSSVSLGSSHSTAITTEGDLFCWGCNLYGEVGNNSTTDQLTPVKVLSNVVFVAAACSAGSNNAAITSSGDLYSWGDNEEGQVGNGTTTNQLTPVKVLGNVSSVSLGLWYSAAITTNGDLYCWGSNSFGQVGDGTTSDRLSPVKILGTGDDNDDGEDIKDGNDPGDEETTIRVIRKSPMIEYNSYGVETYADTESGKIIKAAIDFNKSVDDYLSKLNKQAFNETKGNKKQNVSVGKQLMEQDKDTHVLTYVASDDYAIAAYEMLAEFYDECTVKGIDIGKIKITDDYITISTNIVKKISNSLGHFDNNGERINGHMVQAHIITAGGAINGSITVDGITFMVNSSYNDAAKVMNDYINNLSENVKELTKEALFSVFTELAHYTYIDEFSEKELKTLLDNKVDALQKMGYGDLLKVLKGAKKSYNIVRKITAVKNSSNLKEALATENLKSIYNELSDTDFSDETIKNETVNAAYEKMLNLKGVLQDALFNYIYGFSQDDESFWHKIKRKLNINCPVDFTIYDSDNNTLASVKDGVAKSNDSNIILELNGEEKVIYLLDDMNIHLQMNAIDNGAMDIVIEDMSDGNPISRLNYYDVELVDESIYTLDIYSDELSGNLNQFPIYSDNTETTYADDYFEVSDNACVNINCISDEYGYVENDFRDAYVKGEPVELYAIAYDGYEFDGWYIDDELVELSPLYRFTARNDLSVHATFKEKEIDYRTSIYDIEYGELYDDFAWINIYDKNNSAYDIEFKMFGIEETGNDLSAIKFDYKRGENKLSEAASVILDENSGAYLTNILKKGYETIIITDNNGNVVATLVSNDELPEIEVSPSPIPSDKPDDIYGSPTPSSPASNTQRPATSQSPKTVDDQTPYETQAPDIESIGREFQSADLSAQYKITSTDSQNTVEYVKNTKDNAKTIKIPSTIKYNGVTYKVTSIGKKAFYKNTKLRTVSMGNNVTKICDYAFYGCKKIKKLTIGKKVTIIGKCAFAKCTSLRKLTLPAKVTKIGVKAFYDCKKLKNITIKTTKLKTKTVGKKAFDGIAKKTKIKVPKSKLKTYKKMLRVRGVSSKAKIKQ